MRERKKSVSRRAGWKRSHFILEAAVLPAWEGEDS